MLYYFLVAYKGTRQALARDQGKPVPAPDSFGRLLFEEFPLLSRRIGRWRVISASMIFFVFILAAEIALTEVTPGPVLTPRWRIAVAFAATVLFLAGWAVVHAIRSAGWKPPTREQVRRANRKA